MSALLSHSRIPVLERSFCRRPSATRGIYNTRYMSRGKGVREAFPQDIWEYLK